MSNSLSDTHSSDSNGDRQPLAVTPNYIMVKIIVTISAKTVLNGTFSIMRKTNLKYSSCCGSVVLDFSHARLTV